MGSRVMWVLLAGAALVTGMVVQDGGHIFSWTHDTDRSAKIEAEVSRAVDSAWDDSDVVTIDGREYPVTEAQKEAARSSRDDARKQIRDEVRESIREAVRS